MVRIVGRASSSIYTRFPSVDRQGLWRKSDTKMSPNENECISAGAAGVAVDRGNVCEGRCLICSYYLISEMKYGIGVVDDNDGN